MIFSTCSVSRRVLLCSLHFVGSFQSCSYVCDQVLLVLFFISSWTVFCFVPVMWVSTLVCVFLFRNFLHSALMFSITEPNSPRWPLPMLTRFMPVTWVAMQSVIVYFNVSVSVRVSPFPSPACFLLKWYVQYIDFIWCCPFYQSAPFISLPKVSCHPFWCACLSSNF